MYTLSFEKNDAKHRRTGFLLMFESLDAGQSLYRTIELEPKLLIEDIRR